MHTIYVLYRNKILPCSNLFLSRVWYPVLSYSLFASTTYIDTNIAMPPFHRFLMHRFSMVIKMICFAFMKKDLLFFGR